MGNTDFHKYIRKSKDFILYHITKYYDDLKKVNKTEPNSMIHTDFWRGQLIFNGPEVVAIVDFDALHFGRATYDLTRGTCAFIFDFEK